MQFITIKKDPHIRVRIAWEKAKEDRYSDRTIVIIPGWLSGIDLFLPLAECLSHHSNVLVYEPRGFGYPFAPHKKGLFTIKAYNEEIAAVLQSQGIKDKEFIILGSCSGGSMAFSYLLDGVGPKPYALAVISPQEKYNTPFWFPILGLMPPVVENMVQNIIIGLLNLYLKFKKPEETKNVRHAANQLKHNDTWSQRRFLFEFIHPYDIRNRITDINLPLIMIIGEDDWFANPESSNLFLHHPSSGVIKLHTTSHRLQVGNEEEIALRLEQQLKKLRSCAKDVKNI